MYYDMAHTCKIIDRSSFVLGLFCLCTGSLFDTTGSLLTLRAGSLTSPTAFCTQGAKARWMGTQWAWYPSFCTRLLY